MSQQKRAHTDAGGETEPVPKKQMNVQDIADSDESDEPKSLRGELQKEFKMKVDQEMHQLDLMGPEKQEDSAKRLMIVAAYMDKLGHKNAASDVADYARSMMRLVGMKRKQEMDKSGWKKERESELMMCAVQLKTEGWHSTSELFLEEVYKSRVDVEPGPV
tara:strand:- start:11 stop:493 length:483 start_codon:yes stop_codon:yes gene_type:complete